MNTWSDAATVVDVMPYPKSTGKAGCTVVLQEHGTRRAEHFDGEVFATFVQAKEACLKRKINRSQPKPVRSATAQATSQSEHDRSNTGKEKQK